MLCSSTILEAKWWNKLANENSRAKRKVTPQAASLSVFSHEEEGGRKCFIHFFFH